LIDVSRVLLLLGTFLPVLGMALTFLLAAMMRPGTGRALVLLAGPAATLAVCFLFARPIGANGNMLFIALLMILWVSLCAYYPILIAVWAIRAFRRRRAS
jgi:hypothetical protein